MADLGPWSRLLAVCFDRTPEQMHGLLEWFRAGFELVAMGAWDAGALVAQYNARVLQLLVPGFDGPLEAGMGLNMAVDPAYRGRGLLDQVAAPVHDALSARGCVAGVGFSSAGGLAVTKASRHYAYEVLGPMVSLVVPLTRRRYSDRLTLRSTWPTAPIELDAHRDGFVRYAADPASLRHRYANHPFRRYAYATRERSGVVDGLLVFRETRLRGLPAVSLLAVHGADPETLLGSFAASLRPRRPLVHVLLSPASPLRGALASMGPALPLPFSRSPYHLITRALSSDTPAALFDLDRWACTGGDIL